MCPVILTVRLMPGRDLILRVRIGERLVATRCDHDYDVIADGVVVGRIFKTTIGRPWMWALAFDYREDRAPPHGYEETREAAMIAFARSWRRE